MTFQLQRAYPGSRVSVNFSKVFDSRSGGCYHTCSCGRLHFDNSDNHWDWEEGELEDLKRQHRENPDKVIAEDGAVSFYIFAGQEIVKGCPCNGAAKIEDALLSEANNLAEYLNSVSRVLIEKADSLRVYRKIRK